LRALSLTSAVVAGGQSVRTTGDKDNMWPRNLFIAASAIIIMGEKAMGAELPPKERFHVCLLTDDSLMAGCAEVTPERAKVPLNR